MKKYHNTTFVKSYFDLILNSLGYEQQQNYDEFRFGKKTESIDKKLFSILVFFLSKVGLTTIKYARTNAEDAITYISGCLEKLEWLYSMLADEQSKSTLVEVIAYRALGHKKIKLSVNNPKHWDNLRLAENLVVGDKSISTGFMHFKLFEMDLNKIGYPIRFYYAPEGIVIDFIEQQYRCQTTDFAIECETGDHAIDAGGCWGDTALYFAHKVGSNGKVYSFEFLPDNLKIYNRNLEMNPELKRRVNLIENPIWSTAENEIAIDANGPGTSLRPNDSSHDKMRFRTESIDHMAEAGQIEKVDFIKMDIEGAELNALKGAEHTIRRFKPKLAITVYHSLKDFWEIPEWLDSLGLGYKFYLRHFTIHAEETVLFASVR
jgi:FkbM family methyltransferase